FFIVYLHRVRGIDLGVAGLIVAAGPFASLAGNPISGVLVDRIGARRTVLVGLVVAAAGAASIAFVTEPWEGFAAAGTTGFGVAVMFPSFDTLLAVTVRPQQRSSAFAVRHATMNLGLGLVVAANTLVVALVALPMLRLAQGSRRTAALMVVFVLWAATWGVTLVAGQLGAGAVAVAVFASAAAIFAFGETLMSPSIGPLVNDLATDRLRGRYN